MKVTHKKTGLKGVLYKLPDKKGFDDFPEEAEAVLVHESGHTPFVIEKFYLPQIDGIVHMAEHRARRGDVVAILRDELEYGMDICPLHP